MGEYKTYTEYSTKQVMGLAQAFHEIMLGMKEAADSGKCSTVLCYDEHAVFSAQPGGRVAFNLMSVEGVLDEAWRRVGGMSGLPREQSVDMLHALQREVNRVLGRHFQSPESQVPAVLRRYSRPVASALRQAGSGQPGPDMP